MYNINNYAIYDLEIKQAIPTSITDKDIVYCKGWTDYLGMGVSCGSVCHKYEVFYYTDVGLLVNKLLDLQSKGVYVGGFNNYRFDDRLLQAHGYNFESDFDFYAFIRKKVGMFTKGYKLSDIARKNGLTKDGDGANAPLLYQKGRLDELKKYNTEEIVVNYKLLDYYLNNKLIY